MASGIIAIIMGGSCFSMGLMCMSNDLKGKWGMVGLITGVVSVVTGLFAMMIGVIIIVANQM